MNADTSAKRPKADIAIIGAYPPPYGGISVHLKRFAKYLDDSGFDYILYNLFSSAEKPPRIVSVHSGNRQLWFFSFCLRHRCRIVHLHTVNWLSRLFFGIIARFRPGRYLMTVHGRSIGEAARSSFFLKRWLTRWLTRQMDAIVAVNPYIAEECKTALGIPEKKIIVAPAFLPPDPDGSAAIPDDLISFCGNHTPLLYAIGSVGFLHNGNDAYGLDLMVDLARRLAPDFPDLGVLVGINGGSDQAFAELQGKVDARLQSHVRFHSGLPDVSPLMRKATLFIRPSNTDGDSIAVREALYLRTPVVASDAVPRPAGCVLFKSREINELETTVRDVLRDLPAHRLRFAALNLPDNSQPLLDLYRSFLQEPKKA